MSRLWRIRTKWTKKIQSEFSKGYQSIPFTIEHISGAKTIVADYLSRLVKNLMIEEVRKDKELTEEKKDELILLILHNDIVGHGGVETNMSKLAKGHTP